MKTKRRPRGPISNSSNKFIGGWMPEDLVTRIDEAVNKTDSDRSKFLRAAVRERIAKLEVLAS